MKNAFFLSITLLALSANASTDKCTGQLDAYILGLKTGIKEFLATEDRKEWATQEIEKLEINRKHKTDCEVFENRSLPPKLNRSK